MAFHNVQFPIEISLQSTGGPVRKTDIVTLASGREERNSSWAQSRRKYNAGYGIKSLEQIDDIISFFEARHGRLHSFRWRDPFDNKSCKTTNVPTATDQKIGTGTGEVVEFQLSKAYQSGNQSVVREITKPVPNSTILAIDGVPSSADDFNVDTNRGLVYFNTPPAAGAAVTAGFLFDVEVRFDTDELSINLTNLNAGSVPNIQIVEVIS